MSPTPPEDEKPTPVEDEKPTPPAPPETPPAEETAKEEGEKMPAWGKVLSDQVSSLTEAVTALVPDPAANPDDSPRPEPWHKKKMR